MVGTRRRQGPGGVEHEHPPTGAGLPKALCVGGELLSHPHVARQTAFLSEVTCACSERAVPPRKPRSPGAPPLPAADAVRWEGLLTQVGSATWAQSLMPPRPPIPPAAVHHFRFSDS